METWFATTSITRPPRYQDHFNVLLHQHGKRKTKSYNPNVIFCYALASTPIYTSIVTIVGKQNYKTSSRIVLFKLRDLKSKAMSYVMKEYKNRCKYFWENNLMTSARQLAFDS